LTAFARILLIVAALAWSLMGPGMLGVALAQQFLRDAETEIFIRELSKPIFEAAELEPEAIGVYLINDNSMNAFVAAGQNMFIHSGLIMASDNANQLVGVIAHETGHIAQGHDARRGELAKEANAMAIITMLLGAAAIAAGAGDAGIGLIAGGQGSAQRLMLRNLRGWESTTDQAGATFLRKAGMSGRGLVEFFEKLRGQEYIMQVHQNPYVRTHPLTGDRIARLRENVETSPHWNTPMDPEIEAKFRRVKAKLGGFVEPTRVTFRKYPPSDTSAIARYARIYAYNREVQWELALEEARSLASEFPDDPFYAEITGQIYLENGKVAESLPYYRRSVELMPHQPLLLTSLGHALVAMEDPELDKEAMVVLELAVALDPFNDLGFRQLAVAYSRGGLDAYASHATAEMFLLQRRPGAAMMHAKRALESLPTGSPRWLRAQDLTIMAEAEMARQSSKKRR
jgi:predicted Zn-dependent protease